MRKGSGGGEGSQAEGSAAGGCGRRDGSVDNILKQLDHRREEQGREVGRGEWSQGGDLKEFKSWAGGGSPEERQ